MKYKSAIFDLDGTLLNTLEDLADAVNHTMDKFGYPRRTTEEVRSFVGNGVDRLVMLCLPDGENDKHFEEAKNEYRSYYSTHSEIKTKPYDGVLELIARLNEVGIKTAVVSNKMHEATTTLCKKYFPDVTVALGEREKDGIRRKPNPDMLIESAKQLDVELSEVVYIGDSEVDIETSKRAGVDCISVLWGFRDRDFLEENGGVIFAASADEVFDIIVPKEA